MTDRVFFSGTRDPSPLLKAKAEELVAALPEGTVVITGGAEGIDSIVDLAAKARGLHSATFLPADIWSETGLGLHFSTRCKLRNSRMAAECTRAIFLPGPKSVGTWDAVAQAKRFGRAFDRYREADGLFPEVVLAESWSP